MAARYMQATAIMCFAIASVGMTSCGDGSGSIATTPIQKAAAITQVASATQAAPTAAPITQPTVAPKATATGLPATPSAPTATNTAVPTTTASAPTTPATSTSIAVPTTQASVAAAHPIAPRGPMPSTRPGGISTDPGAAAAVQRAREDLAQQLGIDANGIELLSVTRRFKPTGASDSPGHMIGWNIRLAVADHVYRYQVDLNGALHRR